MSTPEKLRPTTSQVLAALNARSGTFRPRSTSEVAQVIAAHLKLPFAGDPRQLRRVLDMGVHGLPKVLDQLEEDGRLILRSGRDWRNMRGVPSAGLMVNASYWATSAQTEAWWAAGDALENAENRARAELWAAEELVKAYPEEYAALVARWRETHGLAAAQDS